MPRPNRPRTVAAEDNLARRIAFEREARGWTYDGTAKRMTNLGCPIQSTAIYKIEKGEPRRRISVDELVAFARVFELDVEELLIPVDVALNDAARAYLEGFRDAQRGVVQAISKAFSVTVGLYRFTREYGVQVTFPMDEVFGELHSSIASEADGEALSPPEVEAALDDVVSGAIRLLNVMVDAAEKVVRETET